MLNINEVDLLLSKTTQAIFLNLYFQKMSDEASKAQAANPVSGEKTIFAKIIDKEIPCDLLHEDDKVIAFNDIAPQAPTHFLVIPKKPIATIQQAGEEDKEVYYFFLTY